MALLDLHFLFTKLRWLLSGHEAIPTQSPAALMRLSQTSLMVGKEAQACMRRSRFIPPTIATVAACITSNARANQIRSHESVFVVHNPSRQTFHGRVRLYAISHRRQRSFNHPEPTWLVLRYLARHADLSHVGSENITCGVASRSDVAAQLPHGATAVFAALAWAIMALDAMRASYLPV